MKAEKLEKVVRLAKDLGYVLIATADRLGMPHIAAAGKMEFIDGQNVAIKEWFCPGTVANLDVNKCISIVAWHRHPDSGYQMLGTVTKILDVAVLDGYAPELEGAHPIPQVEKELLVKVEKIIEFKLAPHTDLEERS
jgi:hypothetical protein